MGVLQRFVVAFDYARRTMWLRRSSDFAQPDRYDRSGAWLGLDDDTHLTVMDIVDGSPAAQVGIQRGDRVLAVDGIAATPKTLFAIRALLRRPGQREVIFHLVRAGAPVAVLLVLRDLIGQPSDRLSMVGK